MTRLRARIFGFATSREDAGRAPATSPSGRSALALLFSKTPRREGEREPKNYLDGLLSSAWHQAHQVRDCILAPELAAGGAGQHSLLARP